jgi:hypothetical protein
MTPASHVGIPHLQRHFQYLNDALAEAEKELCAASTALDSAIMLETVAELRIPSSVIERYDRAVVRVNQLSSTKEQCYHRWVFEFSEKVDLIVNSAS